MTNIRCVCDSPVICPVLRHTHTIRLHQTHLDVYQRGAEIIKLIQTHTERTAAIFTTISTQALQNYDIPIKEGFF
jgi:hypothetical protein